MKALTAPPATENQPLDSFTAKPVILSHINDIFNPFSRCQVIEIIDINLASVDFQVLDSEIVEWAEQVIFQRGLKPDFARNIMVEKAIHIEAVGPVRRGRHAKQELRSEIIDNFLITL